MSSNNINNIPPEKGKNNKKTLPIAKSSLSNKTNNKNPEQVSENPLESLDKMFNSMNTHRYSSNLRYAAESFLIDSFNKGIVTTYGADNTGENSYQHAPLLCNIAMHILTDASWVQSQPKDIVMNLHPNIGDEFYEDDMDEEGDDE
jgi:hypothetical protein